MRGLKFNSCKRSVADLGEGLGGPGRPFYFSWKTYQTLSPARRTFVFLGSRCTWPLTLRNAHALCCEFSKWQNGKRLFVSRANVRMHQTNSGKSPKNCFHSSFFFCSPICPNKCGVAFLGKYILVFEKWFFSFDHSYMKIFTVNTTRVLWPHVTNILDLRYFF